MLEITKTETATRRRLVIVEADRAGTLALHRDGRRHDDFENSWVFGPGGTLADTDRRLTESDPGPALLEAYRAARDTLAQAVADLTYQATTTRRRRKRSTDGDVLDVSRYLNEPEREDYWQAMTPDTRAHRVCKVVIDLGISSFGSAAQIARLGALGAAAVDVLGAAGIAAHVEVAMGVECDVAIGGPLRAYLGERGWYLHRMTWRDSDVPLDEGALAVLGLPGLMRWHILAGMEAAQVALGTETLADAASQCRNYGVPGLWPADVVDVLAPDVLIGARYSEGAIVGQLRGLIGGNAAQAAGEVA